MRRGNRWCAGAALLGLAMMAGAQAPAANKAAPAGVEAKLDQTLDTAFTKAGDKVSATLQVGTAVNGTALPKGTKLTGSVLKAVKQDKAHRNSGLVLVLDTAVLKGGQTVPVHAVITMLKPSHLDEVEKEDVGSGDGADVNWHADWTLGEMDDPNAGIQGARTTKVDATQGKSSIKGVVLFSSATARSSGAAVALNGRLVLDKWTRMDVVLAPRQAGSGS